MLALLVCVFLWLLFPKGFKFMVGTWMGFTGGVMLWCLLSLAVHSLITCGMFVAFSLLGIIVGCIFAARG